MAWPEHFPEATTVVTITPDYHGTRHQGYISSLKKFTWYLTSVLCFTTPGNGPRSAPRLIQTHEDSKYWPCLQLQIEAMTEILRLLVLITFLKTNMALVYV